MAGTSSDSLTAARRDLDPVLTSGGLPLAAELFTALRTVDDNAPLRRAMTDPSWTVERRVGVVRSLFGGRVSEGATTVLADLAARRWTRDRDFGDALEQLATTAVAASAEREGLDGLGRLADQLLAFNRAVGESHDLQRALTDPQAPTASRGTLAERLLGGASPEARLLVRQAVEHPRGLKPVDLVRDFVDAVAERQRQWIAEVTVARPLAAGQHERLAAGLRRLFGRDLRLDVAVDPELVGGIRVQVGDDVVDSSVQSRLHDLQRKLAG
ncbi:F0F1 ATP synthase subunit delta [Citricoccus sp. SGAir0253]|uniref:F0F1 ATP synthase subunit delta n=1 Tax=Citricoccus sp. SGAir0253 TaxID=2567881 RepID=UPI0010CD4B69|nr:F0F1 ATP synthase subunit delta [Citricoccus sp. SGAir0253]QCU78416.1 F0F1 ATP synthase subunit delta [Citricoccus sp. SGAir0253]